MKAIQITQPFELNVIEMEKPACGEGEVLLRIRYVGFCGSDLNTWRGGNAMAKAGVIPGHEVGAEIAAVGPGVPETLRPGLTVTVNPYTACGHCASCRNGRFNACEFNETLGVQRDGAMREYFVVPWQKVIVTEGIQVRDCALVEPLSVGFHAVSRAQVTGKDVVAVFGCGMIGMGAIVAAALRGATVVAMDIDDKKLEVAKAVGAKYTVNTAYEDVQEGISELTNGRLADVVIEAVGLPETQRQAIANVGFTGRVVFIGYAKDHRRFRQEGTGHPRFPQRLSGGFPGRYRLSPARRLPVRQADNRGRQAGRGGGSDAALARKPRKGIPHPRWILKQ